MTVNMLIPIIFFLTGNIVYQYFQDIPNYSVAVTYIYMQLWAILFYVFYPKFIIFIRRR